MVLLPDFVSIVPVKESVKAQRKLEIESNTISFSSPTKITHLYC